MSDFHRSFSTAEVMFFSSEDCHVGGERFLKCFAAESCAVEMLS